MTLPTMQAAAGSRCRAGGVRLDAASFASKDEASAPVLTPAARAVHTEAYRVARAAPSDAASDLSPHTRHNDADAIRRAFEREAYPYGTRLPGSAYQAGVLPLHIELLKLQDWVRNSGEKVVVLFEGRDAAGKSGTIRRLMEHLNPRGARVVALGQPSDWEGMQWYFQRYVQQLPRPGEIVFFDRSWYNRAGVERVMGLCTGREYAEFMEQVPEMERMLVRSGIRLLKFWFSITREEQQRRFEARERDPLKRRKLTPIDRASFDKWNEYTEAAEAMLLHTDTADAPWTVVRSDDRRRARLNVLRFLLSALPYRDRDPQIVVEPDPSIIGAKTVALDRAPLPDPLLLG